jgi:hypothetical protein
VHLHIGWCFYVFSGVVLLIWFCWDSVGLHIVRATNCHVMEGVSEEGWSLHVSLLGAVLGHFNLLERRGYLHLWVLLSSGYCYA